MNNLLGQFEWRGPQEVPDKTEIIKTLHQELMVKELRIKELEAALLEINSKCCNASWVGYLSKEALKGGV